MVDINRFKRTFEHVNQYGKTNKGMMRLAYSLEEKAATAYFISCCRRQGLKVTEDAAGNVIARREGEDPQLAPVGLGSHLDTVIDGGRYDGVVGTLAALEVARDLDAQHIRTRRPIEIFSFACEESSRFGFSQIGSKIMTGRISKDDLVKLTDKEGRNIREIFKARGLDFDRIEEARRAEPLAVFLEMHIEQGPILEAKSAAIGIVTGIAAPTRYAISIKGHAAHSGSTPMNQRRDALIGAAKIAIELENAAREEVKYGTVATVGDIEIEPGAMNVVPGETYLKVDIRSISKSSKARVVRKLKDVIRQLEENRHLSIQADLLSDEVPVRMNEKVIRCFADICERRGIPALKMPSGAGHDTMNMASLCPAGMIFVPSVGGISHHPDEYTDMNQLKTGIEVLEQAVVKWANVDTTALSADRIG